MRQVTINAVLNGWAVVVGCQTLVYRDKAELLADLSDYMDNPQVKEKAIIEKAVNRRLMAPNAGPFSTGRDTAYAEPDYAAAERGSREPTAAAMPGL